MSSPRLIATSAVAERLDVTPRQVARMVKAGRLVPALIAPGSRGAYLFDPEHVAEVAAQRAGEREVEA